MARILPTWALAMTCALALPQNATAGPATSRSKVVQTLITAAQKEFDAAHFERAGQLFLEIWRQDKTLPPALYNAARAWHLAGKLDKAEELYREYLALPGIEAAPRAKIEEQLADLRLRRAEAYADDAGQAEKAANFALAVRLWGEALQIQPKPAWLLRRARAEHLAGNAEAAIKGYDRYLELATEAAPDRADALRWRAELQPSAPAATTRPATGGPALPSGAAVGTVAGGSSDHEVASAPDRTLAWAVLGGGAAVGLGGVGLYLATLSDQAAYEASLAAKTGGKYSGTAYEDAKASADAINGRVRLAWAVGGVGAVTAGVGAWLLLKRPGKVAVAPVPGGAVVAWGW